MPDPNVVTILETLEAEGQNALDGMRNEMARRKAGRPRSEIPDVFVGQAEFGRWTTRAKAAFRRIEHESTAEFDGDCTVGRMEIALEAFRGVVQSYKAGLYDPAPPPVDANDGTNKKKTLLKTIGKVFGAFIALATVFGGGVTTGTMSTGYQDARNKSLAIDVLKACGAPEKDLTMADGLDKLLINAKGLCGPKGANAQLAAASTASAAPSSSASSSDAGMSVVTAKKTTASGLTPTSGNSVSEAGAPRDDGMPKTRECMSDSPESKKGVCTGKRFAALPNRTAADEATCASSPATLFYGDTQPNATTLYWHVCHGATGFSECKCEGHLQ